MAQRKSSKEKNLEYQPRPAARGARPNARGPRPHVWKSGPDERAHAQYRAYLVHRAQANFRKEGHELTFDQWANIWNKNSAWEQRGRGSDCVCLVRKNANDTWHAKNIEIVSRYEQLLRQIGTKQASGKPRKTRSDKGSKRLYYNRKGHNA
jgi:hypothetical protein